MDKRKLTVIRAEGATADIHYTVDESGECFTGWMPRAQAEEIARRWNNFPALVEALERVANYDPQGRDNPALFIANARAILETLKA